MVNDIEVCYKDFHFYMELETKKDIDFSMICLKLIIWLKEHYLNFPFTSNDKLEMAEYVSGWI